MNLYRELFEISKVLLAEESSERAAATLLTRILELAEAERGFLVVREDGSFQPKLEVGYDRAALSADERRWSRSLVREAIAAQTLLYIPNLIEDARFATAESARLIGRCSVLVAPLRHGGEVYGVVYLEDRRQIDRFGEEVRGFLAAFAEVAGLFLKRAVEQEALARRNQSLERELFAKHQFPGIVTRDLRMLERLRLVAQVADTDASVLVYGETGTGKELIAQALHLNSRRRARPFVALHCAALPATLLESELFGHAAGAFTDAKRERAGRLAAAHGGTLFLDEIGEIPLEVQAKLLRFLQSGELQRLGADKVEKVDVRIVAATHRDLRQLCREGSFREDLFFRLRVLDVTLPPLRDRRGDVPLLLDHFLRRFWRRPGETPRFTAPALAALAAYPFPGNVRELAHLVERACLLAQGPQLGPELLPPEVAPAPSPAAGNGEPVELAVLTGEALNAAREASVDRVERRFLAALMERCEGNVSRAARESGLRRSYLQKLLARHRGTEWVEQTGRGGEGAEGGR